MGVNILCFLPSIYLR